MSLERLFFGGKFVKSNYLPDIQMIETFCTTAMIVTSFERAEWGCSHSKAQIAQFTPELKSKAKELRAKRAQPNKASKSFRSIQGAVAFIAAQPPSLSSGQTLH
jgi:hypothetical protein